VGVWKRGLALALVLCALTATAAAGHAVLQRSEPRAASILKRAPDEVRLYFSERLEPAYSTVRVVNDRDVQVDRRHVAPQLFEPVVLARIGREDVQDDIEVVRDDPGSLARPVDALREQPLVLLQPGVHLVPDRRALPRIAPGCNHEVVREGALGPHVEDHDVLRQLLEGESGDAAGLFEGVQSLLCPWFASLSGV